MSDNFRSHMVMGIIILVLALALIVITFIPRQPRIYKSPGPGSGGQIAPAGQQASTIPGSSSGSLVVPLLTL